MTEETIKKGDWIFWRWKEDGRTFSKSFIQDIIPGKDDVLLELVRNGDWNTEYPLIILSKEIEVFKMNTTEENKTTTETPDESFNEAVDACIVRMCDYWLDTSDGSFDKMIDEIKKLKKPTQ